VAANGSVEMPAWMTKLRVRIGDGAYKMGIGGLHSTESCVAHVADDTHILVDRDVASYYPSIILTCGLSPKHMGEAFSKVYRGLVDKRLAAKHAGDKIVADTLKICVNGSFGKLGSKYSVLYSPDLLIQVTITGQLALLMLIEMLHLEGIPVVSANTDGVVIKCPTVKVAAMQAVVNVWEMITGFETEETRYRALYSRDVNNYLAFKPDGKYKAKGAYALDQNGPVCDTVRACTDIRRFITVRTVKGGALDQAGTYLGKAVRWYYSVLAEGPLRYKVNDYSVARSDGAKALMQLPDRLPVDIDLDWYIAEAEQILNDIGANA